MFKHISKHTGKSHSFTAIIPTAIYKSVNSLLYLTEYFTCYLMTLSVSNTT